MTSQTKSRLGLYVAIGSALAVAGLALALYVAPDETLDMVDQVSIKIQLFVIGAAAIAIGGMGVFAYFNTLPTRRMTTIAFRVLVFYTTLSAGFSVIALPRLVQLSFNREEGPSANFEPTDLANYALPNFSVCIAGICSIVALHLFASYLETKLGTEL